MDYQPGKSPIIKNLIPGLTERGKIKIGRKGKMNQGGWQQPEKLDHFIITTLERSADNNFLIDSDIHQKLGQEPKKIPVRLLFDAIELNFHCRYSCYFGKQLFCSGDGEFANQLLDITKAERKQVPCPCYRQDPHFNGDKNDGKGKCKINGTLSCLIDGAGSVGGVYKFRTTGYNSTVGIYSSLVLIKGLTGGMLAGIPLIMTIQPKVVTSPVDGKSQTIYVVGIEFPGDIPTLQSKTLELAKSNADFRQRLARVEDDARKMISCDAELLDQAGDIVEEHHPEETQPSPGSLIDPNQAQVAAPVPVSAPTPAPEDVQPNKPKGKSKAKATETPVPTPVAAPTTAPAPAQTLPPEPEPQQQLTVPAGLDTNLFD